MIKSKPDLFICYQVDGKDAKLGPFFTATPDGCSVGGWMSYKVQTENLEFTRVTVSWHHSLRAMTKKE